MPVFELGEAVAFPPVRYAEEGLLAYGGDLSPARLICGYEHGIFPWYSEGEPILWWAPEERMVLFPSRIHISRRLRRTIRHHKTEVCADTCFTTVMQHCATVPRKGEDGTWIFPEMVEAYTRLHRLGVAHSIEVMNNGVLTGGLYGVCLGGVFFGESMFSLESNASKIAMVALARQCERWGIGMIDCQMWTEHLSSMGACLVKRADFSRMLRRALRRGTLKGAWRLDADLICLPDESTPEA